MNPILASILIWLASSWPIFIMLPVAVGSYGFYKHAAKHTDGTDDIQAADSGQKGLMTAAQADKLTKLLENIVEDLTPQLGGNLDAQNHSINNVLGLDLTGGQIAFPATQNPSADVNKLDDYEEGIWTPELRFGGNSVGMVYLYHTGLYTKIGRQVTITCLIFLSAKVTSTGGATIIGLPFASQNSYGAYSAIALRLVNVNFANVFQGSIEKGTSIVTLTEITEAGAEASLDEANFANNSIIKMTVTYFTN